MLSSNANKGSTPIVPHEDVLDSLQRGDINMTKGFKVICPFHTIEAAKVNNNTFPLDQPTNSKLSGLLEDVYEVALKMKNEFNVEPATNKTYKYEFHNKDEFIDNESEEKHCETSGKDSLKEDVPDLNNPTNIMNNPIRFIWDRKSQEDLKTYNIKIVSREKENDNITVMQSEYVGELNIGDTETAIINLRCKDSISSNNSNGNQSKCDYNQTSTGADVLRSSLEEDIAAATVSLARKYAEYVNDDSILLESGIEEYKIDLVIEQTFCSRNNAIRVLNECDGDLVNAILRASC